jgi:hypothetical protein
VRSRGTKPLPRDEARRIAAKIAAFAEVTGHSEVAAS